MKKGLNITILVFFVSFIAFSVPADEKITPPAQLVETQEAFIKIADLAEPAVVNISSTRVEKIQSYSFKGPSGENDPFDDFFKHFFPPETERKYNSVGSGFVIDEQGHILTNYHVIERAKDIQITMGAGDNKKTYPGEIVGSDAKTDIAVIKIKTKEKNKKFTYLALGDSNKIRVGEWSIAIGSPFGLEQTLTVGVISAKRQNVSIQTQNYEDLIQTDASINPGNSGGPLVNIRGEVIGINTAIFSPSGGFVGVGFAIPINKAKEILDQLIAHGKVTRGWLGVTIQDLNDELAKSFKIPAKEGVLVSGVIKESPAEKAGIKKADIIISFNGQKVSNSAELRSFVARTEPGKNVNLTVLRNGKEITLALTIGKLSEEKETAAEKTTETTEEKLGITVQDSEKGVIITKVEEASLAQEAGMREGDIIKEMDRNEIKNVSDFKNKIKNAKETVLLLIDREGAAMYVAIALQ